MAALHIILAVEKTVEMWSNLSIKNAYKKAFSFCVFLKSKGMNRTDTSSDVL